MILIYKAERKTYGGYNYIEIDTENNVYAKGCSAAHRGHGIGRTIEVYVKNQKELKDIENYQLFGFTEVDSMYEYHTEKEGK